LTGPLDDLSNDASNAITALPRLNAVRWSLDVVVYTTPDTNYINKNDRLIEVHKDGCQPSPAGDV